MYGHFFSEIVKYLEYLALSYPTLAEVITIGHSYENQPIKMIKISTGPNKEGEAKPAVWIDAGELLFLCFTHKFSNFTNKFYKLQSSDYRIYLT